MSKGREIAVCISLALIVSMFWIGHAWFDRPDEATDAAGDAYRMYIPNIVWSLDSVRSGTLPLWNPYEFAGMPMIGTLEYGPFYPLTWIYALGDPVEMHIVSAWLHAVLFAVFMYVFCRFSLRVLPGPAVVASFIAALSGWAVTRGLMWPDEFRSATWIPLVLVMLDAILRKPTRARAVSLACVLAIQFLAGEIEITIRIAQFAGAYVIFRVLQSRTTSTAKKGQRAIALLFVSALLAAGLVAVQLLPTIETAAQSVRTPGGLTYESVNHSAAGSAVDLVESLIHQPAAAQPFFIGALPLVLAAYALWRRRADAVFFSVAALFFVGLMIGETSWLAKIYYHLPTGDWFRWPERWLPFFVVTTAAAAAIGLDLLLRRLRAPADQFPVAKWDWIFFAAAITTLVHASTLWPAREIVAALGVLAFAGVAVFLLVKARRRSLAGEIAIGIALLGIVLINFRDHDIRPYVPPDALDLVGVPQAVLDHFDENLRPGERVYVDYVLEDARRVPKFGLLTGIPTINGFSPFMPRTYWETVRTALHPTLRHDPAEGDGIVPVGLWGGLSLESGADEVLSTFGVRYVLLGFGNVYGLAAAPPEVRDQFTEVLREGEFALYENVRPMPRAFVTAQSEEGPFDPEAVTLATITRYDPHHVEIAIDTPTDGTLVLTDQHYPGWRARVNGIDRPIEVAAGAFRAVPIDASATSVEFIYAPNSFRLGALVSALTAALCIALVVKERQGKGSPR